MPDNTESTSSNLKKYWQGLFWSISSIIFRLVISIGSSIIFVRYLGDIGYGSVIVMADFVSLAIVLLSMGLGVVQTRVIPQLFAQNQLGIVKHLIYKFFIYKIGVSIVACLFLYSYIPFLHSHFFSGVDSRLLTIALLLIPIQMTWTCFRGILEITYYQKLITFIDISGTILRILAAIPVIYYDLGLVYFFWTQVIADSFLIMMYGNAFKKHIWAKIKSDEQKPYTGKIWSVGIIMMLVLLSGKFLGKEMDTQILSYRLGEAGLPEIAIYSISFVLIMRCLSIIGVGSGGIANLSQAMVSELKDLNDMKNIRNLYVSQIQILYFISIPLIVGGWLLGEKIIIFMYGDAFIGRSFVCPLLFLFIGGTVINYINYTILFGFGYEKTLLVSRSIWGCINLVASYFLSHKGAVGVATATGFCLFGIASYETFFVQRLISPKYPILFLSKVMAGAGCMGGVILICLHYSILNSEGFGIVGFVAIGAVTFYLFMALFKPISRESIVNSSLSSGLIKKILFSVSHN